MEINRRVFLAVLGATAAVAVAKRTRCSVSATSAVMPGGICFFSENRGEPPARPRTAAIIYLPAEA